MRLWQWAFGTMAALAAMLKLSRDARAETWDPNSRPFSIQRSMEYDEKVERFLEQQRRLEAAHPQDPK